MEILIGRDEGAVTVACRGDLGPRALRQLRHVLYDLVDGQGNLDIRLEFPAIDKVPLPVVNLVAEVVTRLSSRGGRLAVATRTSQWASPQPEQAGVR